MDITGQNCIAKYVTEKDIKSIVSKHKDADEEVSIEDYDIRNASDKMLGFLSDYWKLKIVLGPKKRVIQCFLKASSISNPAKAKMAKEIGLFEKERFFYAVIKQAIYLPDLSPWSAEYITCLDNAIVFEDMNALHYKLNDKFKRFDMAHTLEALKTLSRFHASTIIYEENKSKELGRRYLLTEDFEDNLHRAGYIDSDVWFVQCKNAALEAIKLYSNYSEDEMKIIKKRWSHIWSSGLALADPSTEYRNVICHRDLWNNNLMFHYKKTGTKLEPDHCVLVDFQAARYQPPSGDVMLLLYCNLDPHFREENMNTFLNFYFNELVKILNDYEIYKLISRESFLESAEKQRLWAVVVCACLLPQFWIDDDETTRIFTDTVQFDEILSKNKAAFVIKMMQENPDYKEKVMNVFEEIVSRYCL